MLHIFKQHSASLTFMKTSISGSGLIPAAFSLLDNSDNISAFPKNQLVLQLKGKQNRKTIKRTKTGSDPLASSREGQGFPHSHFTDMIIVLTDISSCSLRHKFVHVVPIVCHPARNLQEDVLILQLEIKPKGELLMLDGNIEISSI